MKQFLKFGIVGIMNTLIHIGVYNLLVYLGIFYIISNIIGYVIGTLNSFIWNKNWVFNHKANSKYIFIKFLLVNLITLGTNTLILFLLVNNLHLNTVVSQIISTGLGMVLNYLLNKRCTFAKNKQSLLS